MNCHKFKFSNTLFLQPDSVNLRYLKRRSFDKINSKFKIYLRPLCCKDIGIRESEFEAKTIKTKGLRRIVQGYLQRMRLFSLQTI